MTRGENVLLVHGLWMHALAMRLIQRRLEAMGYAVHPYSYPTVRSTLRENAERLLAHCSSLACRLHFVAHSMGGLVALNAAQQMHPERRGRLVLIGTPFADCYSGRRLERLPGGRRLLGKCMGEWLGEPRRGDFSNFDIGVIAGDGGFGMGRLIAPGLPKPHDGVIAVEETRVPGMRDQVTLPVSHTAMLLSRPVVTQVCAFLDAGRFDHTAKLP
jgi:pimeloyl-ACP methyl ester carboxylesterase